MNRMHPEDLRAEMASRILSGMWACDSNSLGDLWPTRIAAARADADDLLSELQRTAPKDEVDDFRARAEKAEAVTFPKPQEEP